jgi:hypothetical protein
MNASGKPAERRPEPRNTAQADEPAKGGTTPPHDKPHPSGDSPKPHGDKMEHAADEAAKRKTTD